MWNNRVVAGFKLPAVVAVAATGMKNCGSPIFPSGTLFDLSQNALSPSNCSETTLRIVLPTLSAITPLTLQWAALTRTCQSFVDYRCGLDKPEAKMRLVTLHVVSLKRTGFVFENKTTEFLLFNVPYPAVKQPNLDTNTASALGSKIYEPGLHSAAAILIKGIIYLATISATKSPTTAISNLSLFCQCKFHYGALEELEKFYFRLGSILESRSLTISKRTNVECISDWSTLVITSARRHVS